MDYACTVAHCNIAVAGNIVSLLVLLCYILACAFKQRLVFLMLQLASGEGLKDLICRLVVLCKSAQNAVQQSLCKIICVAVRGLYLCIGLVGVHAERHV